MTSSSLLENQKRIDAFVAACREIKKSPVFAGNIDGKEVFEAAYLKARLADSTSGLSILSFYDGQTIIEEWDTTNCDSFYIVASGTFDIFVQGKKIRSMKAWATIWEIGFLNKSGRIATVIANSNDATLIKVDRSFLQKTIAKDPTKVTIIYENLWREISNKLSSANEELACLRNYLIEKGDNLCLQRLDQIQQENIHKWQPYNSDPFEKQIKEKSIVFSDFDENLIWEILIQWSARENGTEILQYNPWELVVSPEDKRNDSFYIVFTGGVIIHDPFDPVRILNAIGRFWVFGEIAFLCPERQRNAMVSAINRNNFRETNSFFSSEKTTIIRVYRQYVEELGSEKRIKIYEWLARAIGSKLDNMNHILLYIWREAGVCQHIVSKTMQRINNQITP